MYNPDEPSKWLVGPYFPHADLNLTGRVRFDVPDPLPLDPASDLPPQLLGSAWIVAAGPGRAGEPDFRGAAPLAWPWLTCYVMDSTLCLGLNLLECLSCVQHVAAYTGHIWEIPRLLGVLNFPAAFLIGLRMTDDGGCIRRV